MSMYDQLRAVWAELTAPGAPFEVHELDVFGNRVKAYATAPNSLRDIWLASQPFAERDYLVYEDERLTYAETHTRVASIANWLIAHGVGPEDRVAIAMRNYPEWLQAYWATIAVGATVSGMNAWWVGQEMVHGINEATPKVLICDEERLQRLLPHRAEVARDLIVVGARTDLTDDTVPWSELLAQGGELPDADPDPDSVACVFYTSGTTGFPKGAQLTHRGCINNLMNLSFWGTVLATLAERNGTAVEPPEQLASLITTPLFHVTANNCVNHPLTPQGGKLVHMYKWDAGKALQLIEAEQVTAVTGVPVMARELLAHPDFDKYDTSSMRGLGGGGAQLQPDLVGKIAQTPARPGTGYGMTETCGVITSIGGDFFVDRPDSAGPVMPNFDAKLVDADGVEVPPGARGELWVRGAPVIKGYIQRPEATAEAITDGWMHTGDIARMDEDGFVYIVDRVKDMVLRGGENVYCAEVEAAFFEHPAVAECSVFGIPDQRLGEEVGAAVFCNPTLSTDAEALRAHCAERIAAHKIPRYIWMVDEPLPRNASGKFLKRELRELLRIDAAS